MLNQSCKLIRLRKLDVRILSLLFIFSISQAHASGAYMPGGSPQAKSQYNQGKMLFHKQIKSQKFMSCMECYKKHKTESQCEQVKQCVTRGVSTDQVEALKYFLKKRYRLN